MMIALVIGLILAVAIFLYIKSKEKPQKEKPQKEKPQKEEKPSGKIYGSMTCRYTVKQIEKYPDYVFVNCAGGGCPSFVSAFPTTEHPDGSVTVGYS
jgi:hypothetical protein